MHKITIEVSDEHYDIMQKLTASLGTPMQDIINNALRKDLYPFLLIERGLLMSAEIKKPQ